jgi:hypothetical protein
MHASFGPVAQIAYHVVDPVASAHEWALRHGAGPFFVRRHIPVTDVVHRGSPSSFDHTSAYGWWGEVMVELFCQHDDAPSAVRERFAAGETGLHHLACIVDDLEEVVQAGVAAGFAEAQRARAGRTVFVFLDAVGTHGHYWELYQASDGLVGFYELVRSTHMGWDGVTDPVRILG